MSSVENVEYVIGGDTLGDYSLKVYGRNLNLAGMLREQHVLVPNHRIVVASVVMLQLKLFLTGQVYLLDMAVLDVGHLVAQVPQVDVR